MKEELNEDIEEIHKEFNEKQEVSGMNIFTRINELLRIKSKAKIYSEPEVWCIILEDIFTNIHFEIKKRDPKKLKELNDKLIKAHNRMVPKRIPKSPYNLFSGYDTYVDYPVGLLNEIDNELTDLLAKYGYLKGNING